MAVEFVVSDYEEKDFDDLREMMFCLYEEDPEGLPISGRKIENTIAESLAHPEKTRITMIRADGSNVGYSVIIFSWSNEYGGDIIGIDELYIKKGYRNKGIASDFIRRQMSAYPDKNIVAINVETTSSNKAAERFYQRLGFERSPNTHWVKK